MKNSLLTGFEQYLLEMLNRTQEEVKRLYEEKYLTKAGNTYASLNDSAPVVTLSPEEANTQTLAVVKLSEDAGGDIHLLAKAPWHEIRYYSTASAKSISRVGIKRAMLYLLEEMTKQIRQEVLQEQAHRQST